MFQFNTLTWQNKLSIKQDSLSHPNHVTPLIKGPPFLYNSVWESELSQRGKKKRGTHPPKKSRMS